MSTTKIKNTEPEKSPAKTPSLSAQAQGKAHVLRPKGEPRQADAEGFFNFPGGQRGY